MITPNELAERIERLAERYDAPWRVVKEHHDNSTVRVADTVTPALAELLCLLHNNIHTIVATLRSPAGQREGLSEEDQLFMGAVRSTIDRCGDSPDAPIRDQARLLAIIDRILIDRLSASPPEPTHETATNTERG